MPDLRKYYTVAALSSFLKQYSNSYMAEWKELMDEVFLPLSFREELWQDSLTWDGGGGYQLSALNKTMLYEWDKF